MYKEDAKETKSYFQIAGKVQVPRYPRTAMMLMFTLQESMESPTLSGTGLENARPLTRTGQGIAPTV